MGAKAERIREGDRLALSRLITDIENGEEGFQQQLDLLYPHTGNAHIIGITGPSGSGKSTLVNQLAAALKRDQNRPRKKIGIIAVDPTSPFTGGALLGDRVRMQSISQDADIFIRSMATRGALGGIALATDNTALAMDAAGFDTILIETVGAGQSEVEIASLAHTTVVVEAPGLGDEVQAAKAGILEIADILVVNKADKPGADITATALQRMLEVGDELQGKVIGRRWKVPVVKTTAIENEGIADLANLIAEHETFLHATGEWEKCSLQRLAKQIHALLRDALFGRWEEKLDQKAYNELMVQVMQRTVSPYQAVEKLLF